MWPSTRSELFRAFLGVGTRTFTEAVGCWLMHNANTALATHTRYWLKFCGDINHRLPHRLPCG